MTPDDDLRKSLIQLETTILGASGSNGLKGEVGEVRKEIGRLYGRDEALRDHVDKRFRELERRVDDGFQRIYRMFTTILIGVLISAVGIIFTEVAIRQ